MLRRSGSKIVAVVSKNKLSAKKCGRLVSCTNCSDNVSIIPSSSNLILIAVPDQSIRSIAESLAGLRSLDHNGIAVCHTSGAFTSDALDPVARKGANVFSLHPVQTFPKQKSLAEQIYSMEGITFGIEGSRQSLRTAKQVTRALGGEFIVVPKETKILYHCACVIASNYSVALIGIVEALASQVTDKKLKPFRKLIETSVENALNLGAKNVLTGPIVRGDSKTISEHLRVIKDPDIRRVYRSLGIYALKMAREVNRLQRGEAQRLLELLEEKDQGV